MQKVHLFPSPSTCLLLTPTAPSPPHPHLCKATPSASQSPPPPLSGGTIRLRGKNLTETEHVKLGAYHTLELEQQRAFTLFKV